MDLSIALGEKRASYDSRDDSSEPNKRPAVGSDEPRSPEPHSPDSASAQPSLAWGAMNAFLAVELDDVQEAATSGTEERTPESDGIRARTVSLLHMGGIRRVRCEPGRRRICATLERAHGFSTSKLYLDVLTTFRYERVIRSLGVIH